MKVHSCHECSYQTERMYNLKVHQKNKHKNVDENIIPQVGIGQAHVVYQQNIQHEQNPDTQPVYHPVNVGGNYQQPSMNGKVLQDHAQAVCRQPVNVGGNYQQPSMNGKVFQDHAQAVCHQSLGVGGNYQQPSMNGRELQDHAQAVCRQPVNVGGNYQQPSMNGGLFQDRAQAVCYQPVNVGQNYQHPMQPQINCLMSQGQIHGESDGAFQHG